MVLKTRSCSLLTIPSKSSPREAILDVEKSMAGQKEMQRRDAQVRVGNKSSGPQSPVEQKPKRLALTTQPKRMSLQPEEGIDPYLRRWELRWVNVYSSYNF
jgi:hypothetical protein